MKFIDINKGVLVDLSLEEFCEQSGIEMPEPEKENTVENSELMAVTFDSDETLYPEVVVQLTGEDGNAFNVMAVVTKALRKHGVNKTEREVFLAEAMAGDYNHLLQTCMKWVTVS